MQQAYHPICMENKKRKYVFLRMSFEADIQECLRVLRKGGIILYPTDTIWGIGCDATNEQAVEKIFALKQRPDSKSMIVLLANERDLLQYISAPDPAVFDYLENVSRPTTIVYDGAIGLAGNLLAADGSVGIRIVKEEFCRHLVKRFGRPIVSTSANISGMPAPASYAEVDDRIRNGVDYQVNYRQNDQSPAKASTVIRWNKDGSITVLRP
jgi:L-threonylcarbamoyladenylate synthase